MSFMPRGNATHVCAGVIAAQQLRPKGTFGYEFFNYFTPVFITLMCVVPLYPMWRWRESPRFKSVRPFMFSAILAIAMTNSVWGATASAVYDPMPCWVQLVWFVLPLVIYANLFNIRAIIFIVESEYARAVALRGSESGNSDDDNSTNLGTLSDYFYFSRTGCREMFSSFYSLFLIAIGRLDSNGLSIEALVRTKNAYAALTIVLMSPGIIVILIALIVVPQYRYCRGCTFALEAPLIFFVLLVFYMLVALRFFYVAWTKIEHDKQKIVPELAFVLLIMAPTAFIPLILQILDPGRLAYNRRLGYHNFFLITYSMYSGACLGYQCIQHLRYTRRNRQRTRRTYEAPSMTKTLEESPTILAEFEVYCATRYISENLRFYQDVTNFKKFFAEKGDNWRVSKAKRLHELYLTPGGNFEINISSIVRDRVKQRLAAYMVPNNGLKSIRLYDLFDEALKDIIQVLREGFWNDFCFHQVREPSALSSRVKPTGVSSRRNESDAISSIA